jgi:hypothetical protein
MAVSREQAISALFAILNSSAEFITSGRRNTNPENLGPSMTPALFLVEGIDKWDRVQAGYNNLAKREMKLFAILYNDVGTDDTLVPNTVINNALDAIEAAMEPDNIQTGCFTLGNLVESCTIDGESQRSSGDTTGKALAVVPIRILFP